jgi:hypothetical protein
MSSLLIPRSLHAHTQGEYYEAICKDIDPVKKSLVCCFPKDAGFPEVGSWLHPPIRLQYGFLISRYARPFFIGSLKALCARVRCAAAR